MKLLVKQYSLSVPEVLGLYDALGVKHEPLRLIAPQFETPFPPLQLAVSTLLISNPSIISAMVPNLNNNAW